MVWSLQNGWLTAPWVTYLSGEWNNNDKRTISTFFMGGIFQKQPNASISPPSFVVFRPGVTWKYIFHPFRMEEKPLSKVKVKRTSCRRALSVKLHPNHGRRRSEVWVNFLGWVLRWVGIFLGEFLGLGFFLGAKKLGTLFWKKAYENEESERIKHL